MKKVILFSIIALFVGSLAAPAKGLPKKNIGIQLYSLRELIGNPELYAKNHVAVLKNLAEMGYTDVEPAYYGDGKLYGITPEQFKSDLAAAGLKCLSTHTTRNLTDEELKSGNFTEAMKWWEQCIDAHKRAGCTYIVTPGMHKPKNLKEGKVICDYHNAIGKLCASKGIKYGYHTHSWEFEKIDGTPWIQYFLDNTDPKYMFWEMDVYWCVMAKESPVQWFKKYPKRFNLLHIKDKYEVGYSGMVGFDAIFRNSDLCGLEGFIIEMEGTDGTIDITEGVRRCANYIRSSKFVKASYK